MKNNKNRGFTLIELMIVIAIIAILLAYALPAYRTFTVKAKAGEAHSLAGNLKTTVSEIFYISGSLVGINSNSNGIGAPGDYVGDWVNQISVAGGVISVEYNAQDPVLNGNTTRFTPLGPGTGPNTGQSLMWVCSTTLDDRYSPC